MMRSARLPRVLGRERRKLVPQRECPGHRAWVRRHHCCVAGCLSRNIECAHVRRGTDGGTALKPSDRWCISLCRDHHVEQHAKGETAFEKIYSIDLKALACAFARQSPHWRRI